MRSLALCAVVWAGFVSAADTDNGVADAEARCRGLGRYHALFSKPVVNLAVNGTASCEYSCPEGNKQPPQIICTGSRGLCLKTMDDNPLLNATCIIREGSSVPTFECVFLNRDGYLHVSNYGFELELHRENKLCVLDDSYRVWYTMDFVKRDYWLILLGVSVGVGGMALIGLITLACCLCWKRKRPREERLIYSPSPRVFY